MKVCLDCGSEMAAGQRHCPACGSPAEIRMPTDAELRIESYSGSGLEKGKSRLTTYLMLLLFLVLMVIVLFISQAINRRVDMMSAGF